MKIEFSAGEGGLHEARELKSMVRYVLNNTVSGSHDRQLLESLERSAEEYLERPEFAARQAAPEDLVEDRPFGKRLRALWEEYFGPSRREIELAQQRLQALEQAERAQHASFEALAETARVGRERDQALSRLKELERRLAELTAGAPDAGAKSGS